MKRASKTYSVEFIGNDMLVYSIDIVSTKEPKEVVEMVLRLKIYGVKILPKSMQVRRLYVSNIKDTMPFYYWQVIDNSNGRIYYYV